MARATCSAASRPWWRRSSCRARRLSWCDASRSSCPAHVSFSAGCRLCRMEVPGWVCAVRFLLLLLWLRRDRCLHSAHRAIVLSLFIARRRYSAPKQGQVGAVSQEAPQHQPGAWAVPLSGAVEDVLSGGQGHDPALKPKSMPSKQKHALMHIFGNGRVVCVVVRRRRITLGKFLHTARGWRCGKTH